MKENWHLVVSYKTELLSEDLIHRGYKESLPKILPRLGLLRNRMIIDNDIYVDLNEVEEIQKILSEDLISYASESYTAIEKQAQKLFTVSNEVIQDLDNSQSNEELANKLKRFFNEYQASLGLIAIPTVIDLSLEFDVLKYLKESGIKNIEEVFPQLAVLYKPVETNKESEDLLDIAIQVEEKKLFFDSSELIFLVKNHAKKYGWLYSTLFLGDIYDERKIIDELKLIVGKAKEKKNNLLEERRKQSENADKIIEQIISQEGKEKGKFFQTAVYFRTVRLEWMNNACFIVKPLLKKIDSRLNIGFEDLIYLLPNEIIGSLNKGKLQVNIDTISERKRGYALISDNTYERALFTGKKLIEWKNKFSKIEAEKEIKGIIACKGQVRGKVVIVKDRSDLSKVKENDILVVPLTTPDFVVAMKKASAIVTDLGGITSHAALVSRELNIPCIVGTKIATRILKNGDEIEVNADEGIVKIIKKS